mmetsp:Transcript_1169/g.3332  ORF Transcript_1169/g.3332 Transcript_1169/m.3332 type:complete len:159 (-) Transcript_1169:532-1008(-)
MPILSYDTSSALPLPLFGGPESQAPPNAPPTPVQIIGVSSLGTKPHPIFHNDSASEASDPALSMGKCSPSSPSSTAPLHESSASSSQPSKIRRSLGSLDGLALLRLGYEALSKLCRWTLLFRERERVGKVTYYKYRKCFGKNKQTVVLLCTLRIGVMT